jgi:hypothetical protein
MALDVSSPPSLLPGSVTRNRQASFTYACLLTMLLAGVWSSTVIAEVTGAVAPPPSYFDVPAGHEEQPLLPPEIQRLGAQDQMRPKEDDLDYPVNVELPGTQRLFKRVSENAVKEEIRQEARRKPGGPRIIFPEEPPLTREPYKPRYFPQLVEVVEPSFVLHGRLYFEQVNFERHGWDLGLLQPAISLATFYKDLAFLPYHYWTRPCEHYDTSAGKCMPGDPTPLYLYPPEWSWTGVLGESATIIGGVFFIH